jgi:PAS domain S-box-containing protein
MASFFHHQMDYIFFIYGLSFILLAVICHGLNREAAGKRPWAWLCLFAWLHGISEWLDLLALSLGDGTLFQAFRLMVMAASFMALLEFGRQGLKSALSRSGDIMGPWLTPALALLAMLGLFSGGLNGLNAAFRYSLGFPGALLAGLAILRTPGGDGAGTRLGPRLSAAALLLYAPATGLVTPAAPFPPADWLNHTTFFAAAGFPVQLLRAACALSAMTGLWIYRQGLQPRETGLGWRRWGAVISAFVLITGMGGAAVEWRGRGVEAEARRELVGQAVALARTLPPDRIRELAFSPSEQGSPVFERIRQALRAYARFRGLRRICTLARRDGVIVRGPGTRPDDSPFRVAPGSPFPNPPPALISVFEGGAPTAIGPRTTPFGTFITALAPVIEPRSGRVLMVVAVDRFQQEIAVRVAATRLLTIGCTLALLLIILGAIGLYRRRDHLPETEQGGLRHLETVVAAILGLALSAAATFLIAEAENREATNSFNRLAAARFERIRQEMVAIQKDVAALARFFEASRHVDRAEFSRFVGPAAGMDAVQAYEWIPAVPATEKARFEAEARQEGVPGYTIWRQSDSVGPGAGQAHMDEAGRPDPDGPPVYYPVHYVEPLAGNRSALGFDLGSEPIRRAALTSAARTGRPTATDAITLVQETERQQAILIFHPVFAGGRAGPETVPANGPLRGFALAVVRLSSLLERAAGGSDVRDHLSEADLIALSETAPPRFLAAFSDTRRPPHPIAEAGTGRSLRHFDLMTTRPVFAFGRAYAVVIHPTPAFYDSVPFRMGHLTLLAGLLMTGLLTLFVGHLRNRQLSLDRRVREQTRELQEGMRLLRTLIDGLPDIVALQKPDHTVLFYNRAGYEFLGLSPAETDGRRCFELIGQDHQCDGCATSRAFKTGRIETSLRFVPGPDRWIEARAIPVPNDQGELSMAIEVLRDVTESKEAEAALRRSIVHAEEMAAEAARANTAKSEFLANMSHEIRTPMNGVLGMAGLLLDTPLTPEQRQYAEVIRSSGETLLTLIDDILDFSKIEAGKMDLERLDFDLRSTLEDFADGLAFRAHQKEVEFHCLVRPNVPDRLRGDPGRLRQILNNLAGNAIKFTQKGEITVIAERLQEVGEEVLLRFSVCDTGIGIPQETQARLFSAFSQADGSTTRKYGGTGLGLAISKRLAELMGGEIGLESVEGEGATFWFTARFETPAPRDGEHQPAGTGGGTALGAMRVLVVDDNEINRMVLAGLLESWGARHDAAAHADQAISLLREAVRAGDPYHAAILDMHMPDIDGEGLARAITADPEIADIRLILLTSLGRRDDARRMAVAGFSSYLTKPVKGSVLFDCLAGAGPGAGQGMRSASAPHPEAADPERRKRRRILVVEDNITNQKVAMGMLRKLGYRADAAADGREAVKALETLPYDLVLMDCQMPEMDGFEATAIIRDPASFVRDHDLPVIALTAYAMKGDRERCLAVGMNDYLAKPITLPALSEMLEKWLPPETGESATTAETEGASSPDRTGGGGQAPVFDHSGFRRRIMDDEELAQEVMAAFLSDIPEQINALEKALARGDETAASAVGHRIKGAAANICAPALCELAVQIEAAGETGDMEGVGRLTDRLTRAFAAFKSHIESSPP